MSSSDQNQKEQLANRIKDATNVLVTVSSNPSVDQLSAAIGLTLFLSKLRKHSSAVFSGAVPSAIDFLKPQETLERNTDSLQDFIIALDKNKADKIRYKVEDQMVKIFITPYRSSVDRDDLQFSKGDFNCDVVIALGVTKKDDLDQAIISHGRILHDATVATVNLQEGAELGTINWTDTKASSLSEMLVSLADSVKPNAFDAQMATALLTGIVAETDRFSNEKTTSHTMNASAKLMAAGADQKLVAAKLDVAHITPTTSPEPQQQESTENNNDTQEGEDGALRISHDNNGPNQPGQPGQPSQQPPPDDNQQPPPEPEPAPEQHPPPPEAPPPPPPAPVQPPGQFDVQQAGNEPDNYADIAAALKGPPPPRITHDDRPFLDSPPTTQRHADNVIGGPASKQIKPSQSIQAPPKHTSDSRVITEPPSMGAKLSALSDDFYGAEENDEQINLPPAKSQPILNRGQPADQPSDSSQPQPNNAEPPPDDHQQAAPQNLAQAAGPSNQQDSPTPPLPPDNKPPLPQPASPQHPPPEPEPDSKPEPAQETDNEPSSAQVSVGPHSKLPSSFVGTLDDKTLKDLERKINSPHLTQAAANFDADTLRAIENRVGSSHKDQYEKTSEGQTKDSGSSAGQDQQEKPKQGSDDNTSGQTQSENTSDNNAQDTVVAADDSNGLDKAPRSNDLPRAPKKRRIAVPPPKRPQKPLMDYEPHESEPPEIRKSSKPMLNKDDRGNGDGLSEGDKKEGKPRLFTHDKLSSEHSDSKSKESPANNSESEKPEDGEDPVKTYADAARRAVTNAINLGGDGRTSFPPLKGLGASKVDVGLDHSRGAEGQKAQSEQESGEHQQAKPAQSQPPKPAEQQPAPPKPAPAPDTGNLNQKVNSALAQQPQAEDGSADGNGEDADSAQIQIDEEGNIRFGNEKPQEAQQAAPDNAQAQPPKPENVSPPPVPPPVPAPK